MGFRESPQTRYAFEKAGAVDAPVRETLTGTVERVTFRNEGAASPS